MADNKLTIQKFIDYFFVSDYEPPIIKKGTDLGDIQFYKDFFIKEMDDKNFIRFLPSRFKSDFYSKSLQTFTWIETGSDINSPQGSFWLFPVVFYKDNDIAELVRSVKSFILFRKEITQFYNETQAHEIVENIKIGILGDYSIDFDETGSLNDKKALSLMRRHAQIIKDNIIEEIKTENGEPKIISHQYEKELHKLDIFIVPNGFMGNMLYRAWVTMGFIERRVSLAFLDEELLRGEEKIQIHLPIYLGKSTNDPENQLEKNFARACKGLKDKMKKNIPPKRCALITTNQVDACIRTLSGLIQEARLPKPVMLNLSTGADVYPEAYPEEIKEQVLKVIEDKECNYLCFSIVDLFLNRTIDLMGFLKKSTRLPIIVGGIHAELYPGKTINIEGVDAICVGEAYESFIKVLLNWDNRFNEELPDFWFKKEDGSIKENALTPFYHGAAFNKAPIPDYSYTNYHLLDGNVLTDKSATPDGGPFRVEQHQIGHEGSVIYSSMGGCSNRCSFCNLTAQVKSRKDGGENNVRRFRHKPLTMVKKELESLVEFNKNMKFLCVMENDFTCRGEKDVKKYCELIKSICDVPFYTMVSPSTLNEDKLRYMIDNGLNEINMGIQTNSEFNKEYYDRNVTDEKILDVVNMINKYKDKIYPFYDFINFNPEESDESILKTIDLIKQFPLPFDFVIHHLTLGEEILLYKRLINEKKVPGEEVQKTNLSDYHNLNFDDYKDWETFYLNLFLEWITGPHNDKRAGRITKDIEERKSKKFWKKLFENGKINAIDTNSGVDIFTLFTTGTMFDVLSDSSNRDFLKELNDLLPQVEYTNQQ